MTLAYLKILSWHSPASSERNYEKRRCHDSQWCETDSNRACPEYMSASVTFIWLVGAVDQQQVWWGQTDSEPSEFYCPMTRLVAREDFNAFSHWQIFKGRSNAQRTNESLISKCGHWLDSLNVPRQTGPAMGILWAALHRDTGELYYKSIIICFPWGDRGIRIVPP
jgi:hypothetical protein